METKYSRIINSHAAVEGLSEKTMFNITRICEPLHMNQKEKRQVERLNMKTNKTESVRYPILSIITAVNKETSLSFIIPAGIFHIFQAVNVNAEAFVILIV